MPITIQNLKGNPSIFTTLKSLRRLMASRNNATLPAKGQETLFVTFRSFALVFESFASLEKIKPTKLLEKTNALIFFDLYNF